LCCLFGIIGCIGGVYGEIKLMEIAHRMNGRGSGGESKGSWGKWKGFKRQI
jgi:hypothetical protein